MYIYWNKIRGRSNKNRGKGFYSHWIGLGLQNGRRQHGGRDVMLKRSDVHSVSLTSGVHVAVNWKWSFIDYKKVRENYFRGVFYF